MVLEPITENLLKLRIIILRRGKGLNPMPEKVHILRRLIIIQNILNPTTEDMQTTTEDLQTTTEDLQKFQRTIDLHLTTRTTRCFPIQLNMTKLKLTWSTMCSGVTDLLAEE